MTSFQKRTYIIFLLALVASCMPVSVYAHAINYELEKAPLNNVIGFYLKLGFQHIIPAGLDHILFVIGLCLLGTKFKPILWQATAFTVAHSITLALSMKGIITLPSAIVEPIIAFSILFIAIENIVVQKLKATRLAVVFLFGLIHGLGFASALNEIGLPRNLFLTSIASFNIGVELGQIAIIIAFYLLIMLPFRHTKNYRRWIVLPLSIIIGTVALYWAIERI